MRKKVLGFIALLSLAGGVRADFTVDVSAEKQEFLGFGVQIWPGQEALEPAYAALGIRWARMSVPGMRECTMMQGSVDEFAEYFQPKIATDTFRGTMELLKRNRVTLVLNAFSIPPVWQDQEKQLPNEHLELFARMWAGAVKCLVENGMPPQWLELFNEPDGTWSGRCWPDKYNKVVKHVRRELDALGYDDIQICGPGLAHVDLHGPDQWVDALDADAVKALGAWSLHGYEWHRRESAEVLREELRDGFLASVAQKDPQGEKPLLITEYGTFCTNYHGTAYLSPRDSNVEKTAAQIPAWNVRVIENGLSFLNEGINALIYWQLADVDWGDDNFGIFSRPKDGGLPQMPYESLRGFFPEVAEGFRVVETRQEPDSHLYAAALKKGSKLVCCVINRSTEPQSTALRLKNTADLTLVKRNDFEGGVLSSELPDVPVRGALDVTVPGDGYVTLVFDQRSMAPDGVSTVHTRKPLHRVEGFGGCAWTGDPGALSVMRELGMSWVRFNIEGINRFDQPDMPSAEYVDYFNRVTEWDRIRYLWAMKKEMDLTFMMVSFGAPPCWRDEKNALKAEHAEDFARLWAAAVQAFSDQGFAPEMIELFNEPDGDWDTYCPPEIYSRVVKAVRRELDRRGLQTIRIVGPGRAHLDFGTAEQWVDVLDDEAVNAHGAWSVHGWTFHGPGSHSVPYVRDSAAGFMNSVRAKDPEQKKLRIMTEFSTKDTVFDGVRFGDHAKQFKDTAADSHPFAIHVAADLLSHLNSGFNVLLFWQMSDQWWEPAGWGLMKRMSDGYARRPVFQALETLLPEIVPGFQTLETVSDGDATVAAFVKDRRVVVALVNPSNEPVVQAVHFESADHALLLKEKQFTASGTAIRLPREEITSEWVARLPAGSLTAAVFEIKR